MKTGTVVSQDAEGGKQGQWNVPSAGTAEESTGEDLRVTSVAVDTDGVLAAASIPVLAGVSVKGVDVCSTPAM
jgi:molybdopterin biosynthesis enzyme